jgi:hypothetical protein
MSRSNPDKKMQPLTDRSKRAAGRIIYQPGPRADSRELVSTKAQLIICMITYAKR